jgi:hypothetical protein
MLSHLVVHEDGRSALRLSPPREAQREAETGRAAEAGRDE